MPFIDPSIMLLDPQLTDRFDVLARTQDTAETGLVTTHDVRTPNVLGIVTPAKPNDLIRLDDVEHGNRAIVIITRFKLNSAARRTGRQGSQRQPDYVIWAGDTFIVREVDPWVRYGPGWVRVLAVCIDSIEVLT